MRRPSWRPLVAAAALGSLMAPAISLADCQPAGPLEEALPVAALAFVGTAVAVEGPVATFAVSEVWAGDVGETVQIRGLLDEAGGPDAGFGAGFSEDDRQWTQGETYLVLPWLDGQILRDNICTPTTEWRPELAALRPATARLVEPPEAGFVLPVDVAVIGAVAIVVLGASVVAFRRR